jgi:hypothetical protein
LVARVVVATFVGVAFGEEIGIAVGEEIAIVFFGATIRVVVFAICLSPLHAASIPETPVEVITTPSAIGRRTLYIPVAAAACATATVKLVVAGSCGHTSVGCGL